MNNKGVVPVIAMILLISLILIVIVGGVGGGLLATLRSADKAITPTSYDGQTLTFTVNGAVSRSSDGVVYPNSEEFCVGGTVQDGVETDPSAWTILLQSKPIRLGKETYNPQLGLPPYGFESTDQWAVRNNLQCERIDRIPNQNAASCGSGLYRECIGGSGYNDFASRKCYDPTVFLGDVYGGISCKDYFDKFYCAKGWICGKVNNGENRYDLANDIPNCRRQESYENILINLATPARCAIADDYVCRKRFITLFGEFEPDLQRSTVTISGGTHPNDYRFTRSGRTFLACADAFTNSSVSMTFNLVLVKDKTQCLNSDCGLSDEVKKNIITIREQKTKQAELPIEEAKKIIVADPVAPIPNPETKIEKIINPTDEKNLIASELKPQTSIFQTIINLIKLLLNPIIKLIG